MDDNGKRLETYPDTNILPIVVVSTYQGIPTGLAHALFITQT